MRERIGNRLPVFTPEQQALLVNSSDFFALQHYSTLMVSMRPDGELDRSSFYADEGVRYHQTQGARKNVLGWDIAPFGFHRLLKWVAERYRPSGGIVVTENGLPLHEESAAAARHDLARVCYLKQYLAQAGRAMREGVDLRGYFVWTLLDNFEWAQGTAPRFGLLHVDFATQRRTAKGSAAFFAQLSESHAFTQPERVQRDGVGPLDLRGEAAQLQRIVNQSSGAAPADGPGADCRGAPHHRHARLHASRSWRTCRRATSAEQGEFKAMRAWQAKAEKMHHFAERQRALTARLRTAAAAGGSRPPCVARCSGGGCRGARRAADGSRTAATWRRRRTLLPPRQCPCQAQRLAPPPTSPPQPVPGGGEYCAVNLTEVQRTAAARCATAAAGIQRHERDQPGGNNDISQRWPA